MIVPAFFVMAQLSALVFVKLCQHGNDLTLTKMIAGLISYVMARTTLDIIRADNNPQHHAR